MTKGEGDRINKLEVNTAVLATKFTSMEKSYDSISQDISWIKEKLQNGYFGKVNQHEIEIAELRDKVSKSSVAEKWSSWSWAKKAGLIIGIAGIILRPEIKELLSLVIKWYFNIS